MGLHSRTRLKRLSSSSSSSLSLLQQIFPVQGSYPGLLHCRLILYQLSHRGSPGFLITGPSRRPKYNIAFYSIGPCFYHQSHPQSGVVFALALSFHSFFSSELQQHIGYLPTWGVHLSVSFFLSFHIGHGLLKAKILKWFAIPFSSGPHSVRTLHHDPSVWGGPSRHGS